MLTPMFYLNWAPLPATMVAEMAYIVVGDGQ